MSGIPDSNPFGLPKMTPLQMAAYLRQSFDSEMHRMHARLDLICDKWGIMRHAGSLAAYRLAEHHLDDWFPHLERRDPLIPEAEVHELFAFTDRFCRDYDFASVSTEQLGAVSEVVLGVGEWGDSPTHGRIMIMGDGFSVVGEPPDDWYEWAAIQLGLRHAPGWSKLDRDIRRWAEWWIDDLDDDKELARRLYMAVETVQWGRRQMEAAP